MNTAARLLNETLLTLAIPARKRYLHFSRSIGLLAILCLGILFSALGLILSEDSNRLAIGRLATLVQSQEVLHARYRELLLEKNIWSSPAYVQTTAEKKLAMHALDPQKIILLPL